MLTPRPGLSVSELSARAGTFSLGPLSFHIPANRVLVVLGPSGAGKTMLLETIAGLRPQQGGQISLAGSDITGLAPERRRIGLVFQDAALFPHLTVRDNVSFGPRASRTPVPGGNSGLLDQLGIAHLADRAPRSLSGGERQRVALARALAIQPSLLLLDEPLSALDQPTREDMRVLLQRLLGELAIPAAHVTHDRDEALSLGEDLAIIVAGQLRQAGPAAQVAAEPADPDTARLLGWTELGHGTATNGTAHIGQLIIRNTAAAGLHGRVQAFYRPEDIELGSTTQHPSAGASLIAEVGQVIHTRPLARVSIDSDPPIAAQILHRDLDRLRLTRGQQIHASLPPGSLRLFQAG